MNKSRIYITHTVVFFIFSVSNIAGCLTPLGDPPLFLGYLMDVPFFWPLINLWQPFLFVFIALMVIYGCIDFYLFKKEKFVHMNSDSSFEINFSSNTTSVALLKPVIQGKRNILLLVFIIALVIITPNLPVVEFMHVFSVHITLTDCLRIFSLFGLGLLSYFITPHSIHQKQNFNFHPISEIARVFLCIFITLAPVSEMLSAGKEGPFAPLLAIIAASDPERYYFWLTGLFSSFLDNAPTYVVFFELAGGNTIDLTTTHSSILVAISLGAVFMGALTYIGNAPNFMVRSIAKQHGVHMPSFFGYMAWSFLILIPIFLIMSFIWL
jgi:Na+/H+ antiporter NhaD/arsenite permease-like protein